VKNMTVNMRKPLLHFVINMRQLNLISTPWIIMDYPIGTPSEERCPDKGLLHFKGYVALGVLAYVVDISSR